MVIGSLVPRLPLLIAILVNWLSLSFLFLVDRVKGLIPFLGKSKVE